MTTRILFSVLLLIAINACKDKKSSEETIQQTPKALADKSSSYMLVKRGDDDLVEELYDELVSKNADLKKLEDMIDGLPKKKADSLEPFYNFQEKNESYFRSATTHISQIQDSVSRKKINSLFTDRFIKYNTSVSGHRELITLMEAKNTTIADLHLILKLVKTLPLIETYQKDNLPSTKPLQEFIRQQDEAIKLADTLAK